MMIDENRIVRAWINAPSTLDWVHKFHGKRCIAAYTVGNIIRVWFTEGEVHSLQIDRRFVSKIPLSSAG